MVTRQFLFLFYSYQELSTQPINSRNSPQKYDLPYTIVTDNKIKLTKCSQ
jgi:hypothetical protein